MFNMANHNFYSAQFWLLCSGSLFFMGSFNMIIPELPDLISQLGGPQYKGLIISLFTLTAAISRPFSGTLTDTIGRKPIMIFGAAIAVVSSVTYMFIISVAGFLFLRLFHGLSTGFSPTGQTALLSDTVPANKRGEAMGIFGISASLGMAGGPALGGEIARHFGMDTMFMVSGGLALIAIIIFLPMKETLKKPKKFRFNMLKITMADIYEPLVKGPAIIMILYTFSFGAILTLVPDFSRMLNIPNKGLYFTVYFLSSLASRITAGKISDKYGRVLVIKSGLTIVMLGLVITGLAENKSMFLLGSALYGFGGGIASPTVFAWTVDLSDQKFRGRGISTMFLSLEIGIGLGALASGWLFNNESANLPTVFWVCASLVLLAIVYLEIFWKNKKVEPIVLE